MKTKVIFKVFKDGEVIALFPDDKWNASNITSYMRIGQHGGASPDLLTELKDATPQQYKELKQELIGIGYDI